MKDIFRGELVRLAAMNPEELAPLLSRWDRDSLRMRLADSDPLILFSEKARRTWVEKRIERNESFDFTIRALADDRLIGDIGLGGLRWNHSDTFVGIALGDRDDWNKGYGTDAMRLILRYAFTELNLHRVSLGLFEYNPRALRSYEKAGFKLEGRMRGTLHRESRRWDELLMGILRTEWMEKHAHDN